MQGVGDVALDGMEMETAYGKFAWRSGSRRNLVFRGRPYIDGTETVSGCNFEIRGNSEGEVLKQAATHAKAAHKMQDIPADVLSNARNAIRDEGKPRTQRAG